MDLRKTKNKMMATAAIAVMAFGISNSANAQVNQQMGVTFGTAAALAIGASTDIDFGTWVVDIQDSETITLTVPPVLGGAAPTVTVANDQGGDTTDDSVVIETTPSTNSGSVTVTTPLTVDNQPLQIRAVITTDLTDTSLSIGNLMYITATETTPAAIPTAFGAAVATAILGGTPEEVAIGGDLVISGAIAESATFSDAVIDLFFQY